LISCSCTLTSNDFRNFDNNIQTFDSEPVPRCAKCGRLKAVAEPAAVRLTRRGRRPNSAKNAREWKIQIDGNVTASLADQETVDIAVDAGPHTLRVSSTPILRSPDLSFDLTEGHVLGFSCRPRSPHPAVVTRWLFWLLFALVRPGSWIGLDPEGDLGTVTTTRAPSIDAAPSVRGSEATSVSSHATLTPEVRANVIAKMAAQPRPDGPSVLVVEHLTKQFGPRTAFSDVSFEVGYGEVFGFLGPNGAGKTTTVRTLGTLIAPTSGAATVAGIPLLPENGVEIRQKIAIMPESPGLYLRLSVRENLEYFAGLYGLRHPDARIREALEAVNLTDRATDLCGSLSKGLRQRVGLARTLLSEPTLMFLDEPTSGLDPVASLEVLNLILALKARGVTIFLTTHRLDEAERLCDRVGIMNTKLRTVGRTEDLREQLFKRSLLVRTLVPLRDGGQLFSHIPAVEEWRLDDDGSYELTVTDPKVAAPDVTRALVGAGADVLSIAESQHSLEDVYLELIADDPMAPTS
jgi:ABC-2 type transport system ATP-binding protein